MGAWDNLSIREKADMMKAAIRNGITTLPEIKQAYNEFAEGGNLYLFGGDDDNNPKPVTTGGAGYVPSVSSSNFVDNTVLNLSSNIMSKLQNWGNEDHYPISSENKSEELNGGIAQRTFLAGRKIQEEEFKKHGFIKDNSEDYGLVKKEVGNHKYPIWQRTPDEISRDNLIPIGNTYDGYTGIPTNKGIIHGGSYPTAYYVDPSTIGFDFETGTPRKPRFYAKSWDLNDYGGKGGSTAGILGKVLDFIGNPVVQTTGYIDITKTKPESVDNMLEDYLYSKGLERHKVDENNPYSAYFFGLPEVTITGKKRRGKKHGYGGHIYDGTSEDTQQMNIPYAGELPDVTVMPRRIANKAWDNLSIREKAAMMRTAVSNGITNIDDIRREYNKFAEGGDTNPPIITTGSTGGHTPAIDTSSLLKSVRTRLYNTINPLSSYYIPEAVKNFVSGEPFEYDYLTPYKEIVDAIWAEYLNIPKDQRRFKTRLEQSAYRPGMKGNSNLNYYKLPLTDYDKDKLVEETNYLPVGKNIISDYLAKYNLGDHTIGRGFDNKGEYISYYDRWDLNPFNGKYDGLNIPIINSFSDTSMGIGHPIEIYDRIYLDDYYGMPKNAQKSLYLPEVTIGTRKDDTFEGIQVPYRSYAKGGNLFANGGIHIKPSHRGNLSYDDEITYDGGTLPELQVTGYAPIRLTTYYPVVSKYPYTGHSKLEVPIDTATWNTYKEDSIFGERTSPYLTINKGSSSKDYNLITNNCADATLSFLNNAFNTKENPLFFTTPGDVRDYAINTLGGKVVEGTEDGSDIVLIPRNVDNYKQLSKDAVLWHNTHDPHSSAFSLKGPLKYNKRHSLGGNLYPKGGSLNPNVDRAMKYFMNKGLTDYQAAGLVGNLMRESSLDHKAVNKDSNAFGLAQWLGDRKTNLFKKYGNNPTFEQQLNYVWDELNSTHKRGLKMLKASKNAEEAARNAMGYYEFSAGPEKAIANMIKHGQDGEDSMRKGVNFAMGIVGQNPVEYVPQKQLPPNFGLPQDWENPVQIPTVSPNMSRPIMMPQPFYTKDETETASVIPVKEPSFLERYNNLRRILSLFGVDI